LSATGIERLDGAGAGRPSFRNLLATLLPSSALHVLGSKPATNGTQKQRRRVIALTPLNRPLQRKERIDRKI
jgi:hypothetical protein